MDNYTVYKDQNFTITKELFISGNARFSLQHLCSIKLERAFRQFPYTIFILSSILIAVRIVLTFRFESIVSAIGIVGILGAIALFVLPKPIHKLYLVFSSGEREVIGNKDYAYLEGLANAFSRSIGESTRIHYNEKTVV